MQQIGRYLALEPVGRGGAGQVYRAVDPQGREVAVKLLLAGKDATPLQRRRFGTEVQALLRVRHDHVVQLLDAGEEGGTPYLVMEWVAGETLAQRLQRDGPMGPWPAAALVCKLARALERSHREGVLHRDLKPANVLLRADTGEPVLTDFGLAKDLEASQGGSSGAASLRGSMLGTPGYWPPEQAMGELERIGPRSDVYGLGALLFACLTARPPHDGETLIELLTAFEAPPPRPSSVRPGVPPALEDVCARCLARRPEDRYPEVGLVARDLQAWLDGARSPPAEPAPPRPAPAAAPWGWLVLGAPLLGLAIGYLALRLSQAVSTAPAGLEVRRDPAQGPAPAEPPERRFQAALAAAADCESPEAWRRALQAALPAAAEALTPERALPAAERAGLLVRRGVCLARLQRQGEAARDWSEAAGLDPAGPAGAEALHWLLRASPEDEQLRARAALRTRELHAWAHVLAADLAELRDDDPEEARRQAQAGLALDPALVPLLLLEARLHLAGKDEEAPQAERASRRALARDAKDAAAWATLAEACACQARWAEAQEALDRALALAPDDAQLLWQRAQLLALAGSPGQLEAALERLLQARAGEAILREMAWLALERAPPELLERVLLRLERSAPGDPTPAMVRGSQQLLQGDAARAAEAYLSAAARAPRGSLLAEGLLVRAAQLGTPAAEALSRRAQALLAADARDRDAIYLQAMMAATARDLAGAEARLRAGLEQWPQDRLLRSLDLNLAGQRPAPDLPERVERFSQDLAGDPVAQTVVAYAWLRAKRFPEAERAVRRALQLDPRCGPALGADGLIALHRGADREGLRRARVALASAVLPDAGWLYTRGIAEARLGMLRRAEASLRQALRLDPLYSEALADLLRVLADAGRFSAAREVHASHELLLRRLRLEPPPAERAAMGSVLLRARDLPGARKLLEAAVATGPHPDHLALLAEVCRQQGEPDRARELIQRALAAEPENALAAQVRARLQRGEAQQGR